MPMLTKGIILGKVVDDNHYMVRIPLLENTGDLDKSNVLATLAYTSGVVESLKEGDAVIVGFEEHDAFKPVIVGRLFTTDSVKEPRGYANVEALNVKNSASLPDNLTIGGIDFENVSGMFEHILDSLGNSDFSNYVPYTGADSDVALGNHSLTAQSLEAGEVQVNGPTYTAYYYSDTIGIVGQNYDVNFDFPVITDGATETLATQEWAESTFLKKSNLTQIDLGTFNNSVIEVTNSTVISMFERGGFFMFTYGNCYCYVPITSDSLNWSYTSPIRVPMPVIYNASGEAKMGILRIEKVTNSKISIRLNDVYGTGFHLYLYAL